MTNTASLVSGTQHVLTRGDQTAIIASVGAGLRTYAVGDRDLVLPHDADELAPAFAGKLLAPWPNRLRDGEYSFDGTSYQVPVSEHGRHTALHGLLPFVSFEATSQGDDDVTLEHTIVPSTGYPWPVRIAVTYALTDGGLEVTTRATNRGTSAAPYGLGFHPWLSTGGAAVDDCTLRVDADEHVTVDGRLLPTGFEPVAGVYDLREQASLRGRDLDDAWVGLRRDDAGLSWIRLGAPDGSTVAMWADGAFRAWQVCTGDHVDAIKRTAVAAEPMTCVADAFRTGTDLIRLEPGDTHEARWGLRLE
ncbi:aldose 1-epimerase family protein [Cellulomonas alba]|uniref:Aldose 1-epimerase family protein n=1 Tax=Cellulomonas alba TaxID=3053467 RepID=A0ABT7SM71_9CELL|nr:aldose 1-epimerase family protein [Cellulomonas alba]MDM7856619.1 aldose 1-epimerase family protein [Cellulomonas alba]